MKTTDDYGPWIMTAHDRRLNGFWQQRIMSLQDINMKKTQKLRRHGIGLLVFVTLLTAMPSWRLGVRPATADDQAETSASADSNETVDLSTHQGAKEAVPLTGEIEPRAVSPPPRAVYATPQPLVSVTSGQSQLVGSRQVTVPNKDKIVVMEGKYIYVDMPKAAKLSAGSGDTIFSAEIAKGTGAILIRGLKSGVGTLTVEPTDDETVAVRVVVVSDPSDLEMKLAQAGLSHIRITPSVQGVTLSGVVTSPEKLNQCLALAEECFPYVVNSIRIEAQQIQLECRVFEFAVEESGLTTALNTILRGGQRTSLSNGTYLTLLDGEAFSTRFEELRKTVQTKMIADPVLVTVSGRPATFVSGGEFPIPVPQGGNDPAVEYKFFGTRVDVAPFVLESRRIRLEVRPQLVHLMHDERNHMVVDDKPIPALRTRWFDVAAELNSEQTLVAVFVHERDTGEKNGFVAMVRPSLLTRTGPEAF